MSDRWNPANAPHTQAAPGDDEPIKVAAFPSLPDAALTGLLGKIVEECAPHTEAHRAPVLLQLLARFGCSVGRKPHIRIANAKHHARVWPLIIGDTSTGAKGTSLELVNALFRGDGVFPNTELEVATGGGLSSGEGLITPIRDGTGDDDPGVADKRLLVVETEFAGTLKAMDRQHNSLDRVFRQAWDGDRLSTMTKDPQIASDPHVVMIGHVSPTELRAKMTEAQLSGGTMNRLIPCASRRVRLLPHGGNLPGELIEDCCTDLAKAVCTARDVGSVTMSRGATRLWEQRYADVRRARPDGPVAKMLARAAPQVLRLALIYSLADEQQVINADHLRAALAVWEYADKTADWMFGTTADSAELSNLEQFIASAGKRGRTRTEISVEHFNRHKKSGEITTLLSDLVRGGQVRQESVETHGRAATRYYAS